MSGVCDDYQPGTWDILWKKKGVINIKRTERAMEI